MAVKLTNYQVQKSNGEFLGGSDAYVLDIASVTDGSKADTSLSSLDLIRVGAQNYNAITSANLIHLLENFARITPPRAPIRGQLWYQIEGENTGTLKIYKGNGWAEVGGSGGAALDTATVQITGDGTGSATFATQPDLSKRATISLALSNTGVVPGTYAAATVTVDAKGRITAIAGSSNVNSGAVVAALGYTPARAAGGNVYDAVNKAGDSMTGPLTVGGAVNATKLQENGKDILPKGAIIMWSPTMGSVPSGWVICDGQNGTPDLRDRFILGAGGTKSPGATGGQAAGAQSITTSPAGGHSHTVSINAAGSHSHGSGTGSTVLGVQHMPAHQHATGFGEAVSGKYGNAGGPGLFGSGKSDYDNYEYLTNSVGGNQGHAHDIASDGNHTHTGTAAAVGDHTHTFSLTVNPPYVAVYFIMKNF